MNEDDASVTELPGSDRAAEGCLSGVLKSITVSELLHFLALHRKSGKLTLRRRQGSGLVVLRHGQIVYAASSSVREAFGNVLVCRGLITEATLTEALERQQWTGESRRLGAILLEMGVVGEEDVAEVVRYQVASVLAEVDQWRDGFFRFDTMEIPEGGGIEVDAQDFVAKEGLNTEQLLLQVAAAMDEGGADAEEDKASSPGTSAPTAAASLKGIVEELPTLVLHGEISQMIMRRASDAVHRGVLFIVREHNAVGIGHFGLPPGANPGLSADALHLTLDEPSVLSSVVEHQETYHGPLPETPANAKLLGLLGGGAPGEVLVVPVVVGGRVELVLYGDNVPGNDPIGPYRSLELVLGEAGVQIEKEMLETRSRSLARARRDLRH